MAKTMKAAVVPKPNTLEIREVPVPEINDDEVLIKVKYTGICGTDWSIYTGKYSSDKLPLIPGHEFSGVITKVGRNAVGLEEGDRVTADINMSCGHCFYCKRGQKLMCRDFTQLGIHTNGSYAEYVKAPWQQIHVLPNSMSFFQGAFIEPVACVIHTAKNMNVEFGSSVAVLGTNLGILLALAAKYRGAAPVIVLGRNRMKLEVAKAMGVDLVIDLSDGKDPVEAVRDVTSGRGADYVIEAVGTTTTYQQTLSMVRPGGTVAAFGITGGDETISVRPFDIVLGEKTIVGSCAGFGNDWNDALSLLEHGRIVPEKMFSIKIPLEDLEAVLHEQRSNPELMKVFVSTEMNQRENF